MSGVLNRYGFFEEHCRMVKDSLVVVKVVDWAIFLVGLSYKALLQNGLRP